MSVLLAIVGGTLVFVGIVWRLNEIQRAVSAAPPEAPAQGRPEQSRPSQAAKPLPRATKAAGAKVAGAGSPQATPYSVMGQMLRRSDRVLMRIPLQVSGANAEGHSFTERTQTQSINRNGASVLLANSMLPEGQLKVTNLQSGQSCRFRVCRPGLDLPGGLREWALECLDPAPNFWGITFREAPDQPEEETVGSLLECTGCHCREMVKLSLSDYRTMVKESSSTRRCIWCGKETPWKFAMVKEDWGPTPLPAQEGQEQAVPPAPQVERRKKERRIVRLPVSIRHEDGREEFTIAESASGSGVCCAAKMELVTGDRVFARLMTEQGPTEEEFPAQIVWRRKLNERRGFLYGIELECDLPRT